MTSPRNNSPWKPTLLLRGCQGGWRLRLSAETPWYVQPALEARRALGILGSASAVMLAACGQQPRQDENEPKGNFKVEVTRASFPSQQKLAKRSNLVIVVRNNGDKTVPNLAVTLNGFDRRVNDPDLADPNRPIFAVNGRPQSIGGFPEAKEAAPAGAETALVNTWALGKVRPGKEKKFKWTVTAVKAGPFHISYKVAAGLNGKARAVGPDGTAPRGRFDGTVSDTPPQSRVADDGHTVINGTR
jgi:hypothetical protein